ncbi:MAG: M23 family metallopeptidase [Burkholderiales bacterium]|nr:M23 family metallopeptidase [Burkholderiales bacterium]
MLLLDPIKNTLLARLSQLNDHARRHPRRVVAVVCSLLGGFAVTAFGIAPLAPDAANLPQRLVTEAVPLSGLEQQLEALALHNLELSRSDLTRASDTADSLLRRLGVVDATAAAFIRRDRDARRLIEGRAGKLVQVVADEDGSLRQLVARFPALDSGQQLTHFTRLTVRREQGQWRSQLETAPLLGQVRMGSGTIRSSLFAATDEARLPDAIASQLVDIFSTDIDFHRQLRKGDTFSVVFEALTADDQPITWNEGTGRILAAEFTNNGKTLQALWFKDPASGRGAYFGFDGQSKRRAFLASPMEFSRVTSGFAMRLHPILQTWRAHNGVDYGAPAGTPVRSVGDGVVESAGWQNGYGNVVNIKHGNDKSTVYAHLSRIDVRKGQRVEQGQRLGAVGSTGWATGPHLHFEFRVNGQFQDPMKVARAAETLVIDAAARPRFQQMATVAQAQLTAAESLIGYRGDAE